MAKIMAPAEADDVDTISIIARRRRLSPLYVVTGNAESGFTAAKWKLPAHRVTAECAADNALIYCAENAGWASKTADAETVRKRFRPGSVTLIPSGEQALYALERPATFLELYISPARLRRYSEQHTKSGRGVTLKPLFAENDAWLAGYFYMLHCEIETYGGAERQIDSVLFGQVQQLLLRHLVRAYSDASAADLCELEQPKGTYVLRPHLLRRVKEFVRANIAAEICLGDLARLVNLSETHFIRAFHGAAGRTPHRYILDERLQNGAALLLENHELSIADVAKSMGFKNQAHFATKFKARYGVTPSRYRNVSET